MTGGRRGDGGRVSDDKRAGDGGRSGDGERPSDDERPSDGERSGDDERPGATVVALVVAGVVGPGVVAAVLANTLGRPRLATLAWVAGYGAVVMVAWLRWVRPLELRGSVDRRS